MSLRYADLSDAQKLIYIKRYAVIATVVILLFAFCVGLLFAGLSIIYSLSEENNTEETNKDVEIGEPELTESITSGVVVLLVLPFIIFVYFGSVFLAVDVGAWVANKLNLVTDIDLKAQQKRLDEIKKSLEKQKQN